MSVLESVLEGKVVGWATKQGFLALKVKFVEAGYPDRLFISPNGVFVFIEFKRKGRKPDALQAYRIKNLKARNVRAYWSSNFNECISYLTAAMEPA